MSLITLEMYTNLTVSSLRKEQKIKTFLETILCIQTKISKEALMAP